MKRAVTLAVVGVMSTTWGAAKQASVVRLDGSTITSAEIDSTVTRLMNAAEVTGAEIALLNRGRIVYSKGYGLRDKEKGLAFTNDSIMSAASISKSAFAYLVMKLVDDRTIDLDKPVYLYLPRPLPEYPRYADLAGDERYKRITARMLLSHTSGFANWRWVEDDRKLKIHFEPGARYAYSGEGIDLLQLVVETITHQPLEVLMRDRVFEPLGMTRTSMVWEKRFEGDYANGYDEYGRSLGAHRWKAADAAGSMVTTAADVARLVQAVMEGKGLTGKTREQMLGPQIRIVSKHEFPSLSEETTDEYKTIRLSYGLGWGLYWTPLGEAFFKEGHDDGWRNYTVGFTKPKSGIVILTNSGNGEGIFKYLLETLERNSFTPIDWEGYTPYDRLPPRPPLKPHKQVAVDGKVLDRYVGLYKIQEIVLTIRREGDHLSVQENDEPKQDLLPESQFDFFSTSSDDRYTFQLDRHGLVTGMVLHLDGRDLVIQRLE
jgi:CubicO group peptidase (beta-lactamase class C family)